MVAKATTETDMPSEYFPCSPNPDCKYWNRGCFEDTHHLYQVEERMTRLQRIFRNLPQNLIETCRNFHEQVLDPSALPYPEPEVMRQTVIDADTSGEIRLSENKRRAVYGA